MLIWTETFIHFKVLHYFQLSGEVPIKTLSTHDICRPDPNPIQNYIRPQCKHGYSRNVPVLRFVYCIEVACPSNVAWNAWLWHLVVLRKLQESTTVWETLALQSYILLTKISYAIIG